jgi:hypothetical protein
MNDGDTQPKEVINNLQKRIDAMREKARVDKAVKKQDKEKIQAEEGKQLALFKDADEVVRAELNTGKFANFIFISPRSEKLSLSRTFTHLEGENRISLRVVPALYETPKTLEQQIIGPTIITSRYWYSLLQIWESRGCPRDGFFITSGAEIFRILDLNAGKATYQQLFRELTILSRARLRWDFSFVDKKDGHVYQGEKDTSFVSTFSYIDKKNRETEDIFAQNLSIHLNGDMVANMMNGIRKPVRFREYLKINSYDASRLYNMLDIFLSNKRHWERNSIGLFEDLDITGERYKTRFARREKIKEFISELDGKRISKGILKLELREGKTDAVIVASLVIDREPKPLPRPSINDSETIRFLTEDLLQDVPFLTTPNPDGSPILVARYAMSYPREVIHTALSRYRADAKHDPSVRSRVGMFTAYLHREVHRAQLIWIGKCYGAHCPHQPDLVDRTKDLRIDKPE